MGTNRRWSFDDNASTLNGKSRVCKCKIFRVFLIRVLVGQNNIIVIVDSFFHGNSKSVILIGLPDTERDSN